MNILGNFRIKKNMEREPSYGTKILNMKETTH